MRNALAVAVAIAVLACAPTQETAQSDTQPVDTLKAATETLPSMDSVPTATPTQTKTTIVPPVTTNTKTSPDTQTKRDSIIGRDKVTPFDPTKRRLDTVRRRPPA